MRKPHPENAPGNWYVDTSCTNCSAAQTVAPGLIVERDGQSVFARQPQTDEELLQAWRARLLCPSASVRTEREGKAPSDTFPELMTEGVYRLGYNAASSYGAHSFAILRKTGNFMVDSPRWTHAVVETLERWGGLSAILLTHEDDIGDSKRYAEKFGANVWIHEKDRAAAPFADKIIEGFEPVSLAPDLLAIPTPGHTRGSVCYLWQNRCLFTGDSLAWDFADENLTAFHDYCWSWQTQQKSLNRLLDYSFEWIFAGHGGSRHVPVPEMHGRLKTLIARMAERN
jgi:glyoxylase-like metal-dependent hydrolase (beta-lactamase superfamily II)